jgi:hypothetical protein
MSAPAFLLSSCSRVTGLPEVPAAVSAHDAGLDALPALAEQARRLESPLADADRARFSASAPATPLEMAVWGRDLLQRGRTEEGLHMMAEAALAAPSDLVIVNAFRMAVLRAQLARLQEARLRGDRMPEPPPYLRGEPLATLDRAAAGDPSRELQLQIALAYVDTMVLHPALEVKAPASIDSVRALTALLDRSPWYVPALVGRGLNHLYRPNDLVWPEKPAPPPDAARADFALAAAVGAKVGGAPPRLKGLILVMLGDACAHEGRVDLARSWWVLARETSSDERTLREIGARMSWTDQEAPRKLQERLEERMADLDHPVGDLSFLWSDAEGPS